MASSDESAELLERAEVLSVPVRGDLLDALLVLGAASSAELARFVREGRAATRWHMERLEAVGMVKRRPGEEPTVWEPDSPRTDWSDPSGKGMNLALQEMERVVMDRRRKRMSEWALGRWESPWVGTDWSNSAISRDYVLPAVRAEDLDWLDKRLLEVMDELRARVAEVDPEEDEVEAAFVTVGAFPWRPVRPR